MGRMRAHPLSMAVRCSDATPAPSRGRRVGAVGLAVVDGPFFPEAVFFQMFPLLRGKLLPLGIIFCGLTVFGHRSHSHYYLSPNGHPYPHAHLSSTPLATGKSG